MQWGYTRNISRKLLVAQHPSVAGVSGLIWHGSGQLCQHPGMDAFIMVDYPPRFAQLNGKVSPKCSTGARSLSHLMITQNQLIRT